MPIRSVNNSRDPSPTGERPGESPSASARQATPEPSPGPSSNQLEGLPPPPTQRLRRTSNIVPSPREVFATPSHAHTADATSSQNRRDDNEAIIRRSIRQTADLLDGVIAGLSNGVHNEDEPPDNRTDEQRARTAQMNRPSRMPGFHELGQMRRRLGTTGGTPDQLARVQTYVPRLAELEELANNSDWNALRTGIFAIQADVDEDVDEDLQQDSIHPNDFANITDQLAILFTRIPR